MSPHLLWQQAHDEHPDDTEKRRERYIALMVEAGNIVQREPGPAVTVQELADRQKAEWEQRADRLVAAVAYRMQGNWKPEYAAAVKTALWAYEKGEAS